MEWTADELERRWRGHTPRPQGIGREYAVLVPLVERAGTARLLFEVRAETLRRQPGEICFPGGQMEPGETPWDCALRETWEELGIPASAIRYSAALDYLVQPGGLTIYPVLGRVDPAALEDLRLNPAEVKEIFLPPVEFFRTHPPQHYAFSLTPDVPEDFPYEAIGFPQGYPWRMGKHHVYFYPPWEGKIVWGLTGRVVSQLVGEEGEP